MADRSGRDGYPLDVAMDDGRMHVARYPGGGWGDTVMALCGRVGRRSAGPPGGAWCAACVRRSGPGGVPELPSLTPEGHQHRAVDVSTGQSHPISEGLAERYRSRLDDQYRVERRPLYAGPWEPFLGSPAASEPAGVPEPPEPDESPEAGSGSPLEVRVVDLSVLDLRPGDTIVLRTTGELDDRDVRAIQDSLREALPAGHQVLVIQGTLELSLLRPEKRRRLDPCPTCKHSPRSHYPSTGCIRCACNQGKATVTEE